VRDHAGLGHRWQDAAPALWARGRWPRLCHALCLRTTRPTTTSRGCVATSLGTCSRGASRIGLSAARARAGARAARGACAHVLDLATLRVARRGARRAQGQDAAQPRVVALLAGLGLRRARRRWRQPASAGPRRGRAAGRAGARVRAERAFVRPVTPPSTCACCARRPTRRTRTRTHSCPTQAAFTEQRETADHARGCTAGPQACLRGRIWHRLRLALFKQRRLVGNVCAVQPVCVRHPEYRVRAAEFTRVRHLSPGNYYGQ